MLDFEILHHLNSQQFDRLDHGLVVDELEEPVLPSRLLPGGVHQDEQVRQRGPDTGVGEIDELRGENCRASQLIYRNTFASTGIFSSL